MVDLNVQKNAATHPNPSPELRKPVGACLVDAGVITQSQLDHALNLQARQNAPLGEILVSEGWASRKDVLAALSAQTNLQIADLTQTPPLAELSALKPKEFWLRHNVIPWLRIGPFLFVATARPPPIRSTARLRGFSRTSWPKMPRPA